jgi:hypothetical protein
VRNAVLVLAVALAAALAATGATPGATGSPLRLQVTFAGSAQGHFADVERWTSLETNQCVLRRSRDQSPALSWSLSWRGAPGGRAVQAAPPESNGSVSGTVVRDSCDISPDRLPADAPQDWLLSVACNDPLEPSGSGALTLARKGAQLVIGVATPDYAVSPDATCTASPRADQFHATVPLALAAVSRLKPGASLSVAVGSAVTRFGAYAPQLNCMHAAKPYDGYRSFDTCLDLLTWSGTLRVTRL